MDFITVFGVVEFQIPTVLFLDQLQILLMKRGLLGHAQGAC